jgi:hypothetical protein
MDNTLEEATPTAARLEETTLPAAAQEGGPTTALDTPSQAVVEAVPMEVGVMALSTTTQGPVGVRGEQGVTPQMVKGCSLPFNSRTEDNVTLLLGS